MNKFHWHLKEDQGWRIEIKKYPKLTEIGSKRKDTKIGGWLTKKFRGIPHEGFYTQDEIREIVAYAQDRFIEIIPEIDMPGHSLAAIASYPELSCTGEKQEVAIKPGIYPDVYCPGNEKTFEFLQNVIDEVVELFPSPIFHIGGDEVPKTRWELCPKCQALMKEIGISNTHDLQVYFTNRIGEYLKKKGRRLMGWNEILGESLAPDAIAQWWVGNKKKVLHHLHQGRNFVMSKVGFVYFDYNYVLTPLKKCYNYEPIPKELEEEYHNNVLGIEAPLWTEWVPTKERLGWQVFPRLFAVAETGWTPKHQKNYSDFKQRLKKLIPILSKFNLISADLSEVDPSAIYRLFHLISIIKWPEI
jgi:hexosaminidase